MILDRLEVRPADLALRTGWHLEPEGACKGDRCVPLPTPRVGLLDVRVLAERLGMALVHDSSHGLWALGPESGERALLSAEMPALTLPDRDGNPFSLSSLRRSKVLLLAWASW
jgi:hypothetical protein